MKEKFILIFLGIFLCFIVGKSIASNKNKNFYVYKKNNQKNNNESNHKRVNCQQCCKDGRFASRECIEQCGSCEAYSDEAKAEAWDFPSN